jgi:3'-5' exoribonuclease
MKDVYIADLAKHENQFVTTYFAATQKQLRSSKNGSPYLALTLADRTGQIEARMWENVAESAPSFEAGDVVKVRAQVCRYQERLQLSIDRIRGAMESEYQLGDYVLATTRNVDAMWAELNVWIDSFSDPHLRALGRAFLDDEKIAVALREAPAAKSMHHAWLGGLLEHILSLMSIADLAARHYSEVNRDLLLTGVLLHDIGKLEELSWGLGFDYTMQGQLLGHITIGIGMVEKKIAGLPDFPGRLRLLVEHLILSHHGRYEFGSPKLPMTPEAILLHYLDDLDAKMQTVRSELARSEAAGRSPAEVTDWVRSMERPLLNSRAFLGGAKPTATSSSAQDEAKEVSDAVPAEDRAGQLFDR